MNKITTHIVANQISTNSSDAHSLYQKSWFGESSQGKIHYSPFETLFLLEKNKLEIKQNSKTLSQDELIKKFQRADKKFSMKYTVYKDLRKKGYVVKTALKFGAEFRVYEKSAKPAKTRGQHSKWIVFVEQENKKFSWHEFTAKTRVAHSTKKKLLLALVDQENSITYHEVGWVKP